MSDDTPKTTLTQRRNQIMSEKDSGASKLSQDKLPGSATTSFSGMNTSKANPGNAKAQTGSKIDRRAMARIVAWILIVAFLGIGSALVVTSLLGSEEEETESTATETENVDLSSTTEEETEAEAELETGTDTSLNEENEEEFNAGDPGTDLDSAEQAEEDVETESPDNTTNSEDLSTFSTNDRSRSATRTGNTVALNTFSFEASGGLFYFQFGASSTGGNLDPAIQLRHDEEKNIVLTFTNVATDAVTGNNNTGGRTVQGINGISGWETENSGNTSTYKFLTTRDDLPSRVVVDEAAGTIRFEVEL
ncbi:MAG: hypothetical protein ACOCXP_01495 [Candidatus Dojkabacteria bacterium]